MTQDEQRGIEAIVTTGTGDIVTINQTGERIYLPKVRMVQGPYTVIREHDIVVVYPCRHQRVIEYMNDYEPECPECVGKEAM